MKYVFNTEVLFLLAKLAKYFENDIEVIQAAFTKNDEGKSFFSLLFKVITTLPDAKEDVVKLLALATKTDVSEVQKMDAYEFLKELRSFLMSIDWNKLMGESLGLVLPETKGQE